MPIQLAVERGNTKVIEVLLRNGADPNHGADTYGGWSALHLAAYWGHLEAAALLRDRGARVDIHAACLLDDDSAVRAILADDPEAAVRPDLGGVPPLHVAMSVGTAGLLLDHKAQLNTLDSEGNTPLGASQDIRGRSASTPWWARHCTPRCSMDGRIRSGRCWAGERM